MKFSPATRGPGSTTPVVTPDEARRWNAALAAARAEADRLGRRDDFERRYREHKRSLLPPEAALLALDDVRLVLGKVFTKP